MNRAEKQQQVENVQASSGRKEVLPPSAPSTGGFRFRMWGLLLLALGGGVISVPAVADDRPAAAAGEGERKPLTPKQSAEAFKAHFARLITAEMQKDLRRLGKKKKDGKWEVEDVVPVKQAIAQALNIPPDVKISIGSGKSGDALEDGLRGVIHVAKPRETLFFRYDPAAGTFQFGAPNEADVRYVHRDQVTPAMKQMEKEPAYQASVYLDGQTKDGVRVIVREIDDPKHEFKTYAGIFRVAIMRKDGIWRYPKVDKARRERDGGSTVIELEGFLGSVSIPARGTPTFNSVPLTPTKKP